MGRGGMNREQYSLDSFLGTHSDILRTTLQEPVAAQNREYMSRHPEAAGLYEDSFGRPEPDAKDPEAS